jgi:hypothetical protein
MCCHFGVKEGDSWLTRQKHRSCILENQLLRELFCFGEDIVEFTSNYKYLGLFIDEHNTFLYGTSALADSESRALGEL